MNEFLLRIEEACLHMEPVWLLVPGVIAAALGLFLWLGGTRFSFFVVGFLGALVGGGIGLLVSQWFETPLLASAGVGAVVLAVLAVLMENLVIMLLATVIFAAVCGTTYMSFSLDESWKQTIEEKARLRMLEESDARASGFLPGMRGDEEEDTDAGEKGAVGKFKSAIEDLKDAIGPKQWMLLVWIVVGAAVGLLLGYLVKRLVMALCCSIVGAAMVIGGILSLLLAKQTAVVSNLQGRPRLMPMIFVVMVLFGALIQLLLAGSKKVVKSHSEDKDDE